MTIDDLCIDDVVFQIGVAPLRIDILTSITGVRFDEAWLGRVEVERDELMIAVIGAETSVKNKEALGARSRRDRRDACPPPPRKITG